MVAMAVPPDIAATGRRDTLRVSLNRHGVCAVVPNHLGADFCAPSFRRKEGIHIASGFLARCPGPMASDSGCEEIEIGVGHRETPLMLKQCAVAYHEKPSERCASRCCLAATLSRLGISHYRKSERRGKDTGSKGRQHFFVSPGTLWGNMAATTTHHCPMWSDVPPRYTP